MFRLYKAHYFIKSGVYNKIIDSNPAISVTFYKKYRVKSGDMNPSGDMGQLIPSFQKIKFSE